MAQVFLFTLLVSLYIHFTAAAYQQSQDYSGDTFFDGWNFFTGEDPTGGFVQFKDHSTAAATGLIKTQAGTGNVSKQAYMGVDRFNVTPNGRPSVRIESKAEFNHGLIIADIAHAPGGICGTWPAFWMLGSDPWPANGEIDIVEGVNDQTNNAMTLHTDAGVFLQTDHTFNSSIKGKVVTPNCDVAAKNQPNNSGCTIKDDDDLSFGSGFNGNGGGVYATEWTSEFIKIWFFPRYAIPADILSGNPTPNEAWGIPSSSFSGNFDIDAHFKDLRLVFDTTFCGDYAGATFNQSSTCASKATSCNAFVQNNPSAFVDAYWLINSVKVFENNGSLPIPGPIFNGTLPLPNGTHPQPPPLLNGTHPHPIFPNGTHPHPHPPPINGTAPIRPPPPVPAFPPGNNLYNNTLSGKIHGGPPSYISKYKHHKHPTLNHTRRSGGAVLPLWKD